MVDELLLASPTATILGAATVVDVEEVVVVAPAAVVLVVPAEVVVVTEPDVPVVDEQLVTANIRILSKNNFKVNFIKVTSSVNSPEWTRTTNTLINSQVLYH